MPKLEVKAVPDEELARRLHEELNQDVSPNRRSRKAPSFYSPQFGGGDNPTSDEDKATSAKKGSGKKPGKTEVKAEKAASSPAKVLDMHRDDSAEVITHAPQNRQAKRQKIEAPAISLGPKESRILRDRPSNKLPAGTKSQNGEKERDLAVRDSASELGWSEGWARGSSTDRSLKAEPNTRLTRSQAHNEEVNNQKERGSGRSAKKENGFLSRVAVSTRSDSFSQGSGQDQISRKNRSIPKMPMARQGNNSAWYRARKIGENKNQVHLEFPGLVGVANVWLAKDSPHIWAGSYKGKDWKHLGDGAWEPKVPEFPPPKKGRGRKRGRGSRQEQSGTHSSSDESSEDEEIVIRAMPGRQHSLPMSSHGDQASIGGEPDNHSREVSASEHIKEEDNHAAELKDKDEKDEKIEDREEEDEKIVPGNRKRKGGRRGGRPAKRRQTEIFQENVREDTEDHPENEDEQKVDEADGSPQMKGEEVAPNEEAHGNQKKEESMEVPDEHEAVQEAEPVEAEKPGRRRSNRSQTARQKGKGGRGKRKQPATEDAELLEEEEQAANDTQANHLDSNGLDLPLHELQNENETDAIEALGALAEASAQMQSEERKNMAPKASARNQKRALARAKALDQRLDSLKGTGSLESYRSASLAISPKAALLAKVAEEEEANAAAAPPISWKGSWKLKHFQRLEEIEAEEVAAEHEDLIEELGPQAALPLLSKRPVRGIKVPKPVGMEKLGAMSKGGEIDLEGVSPSPQRGGRGRGRWANHVKKGTKGAKAPSSTPQDTPRATRRGGRGGRGGGRWGNRQTATKQARSESICLATFGGLMSAMDEKRQSAVRNLPDGLPSSQPYQKILDIPAERMLPYALNAFQAPSDFSFKMPPPPVPLFRPLVSPLFTV